MPIIKQWDQGSGTWKIASSGYAGSQGVIGYTGSASTVQGPLGYTGSASTVIGYTGSRGAVGYTGSKGVGYTGSLGYTGSQGIIGYTGSAPTGYVVVTGDTMEGILYAQTNTSYTTGQVRNVFLSTGDPTGGANGDVWIKYTA